MKIFTTFRLLLIFVFSLTLLYGSYAVFEFNYKPLITSNKGFVYHYQPGSTVRRLSKALQEEGYLSSPIVFRMMVRIKGVSRSLQAGEYYFPPGTTGSELLNQLSTGKVIQHALTLIEGWTLKDVLNALNANSHIKHTLSADAESQIIAQLGILQNKAEGWFFPETYHFPTGLSDIDFLKRAYQTMLKQLQQKWQNRDSALPYRDPYDALIVASLVEKETAIISERAKVSDVIVERLNRHMPLQIDPTVIYAVSPADGRTITKQDLLNDSPYNTYRHRGLPPSPIALPSASSIDAALHPTRENNLYFVANPDGTHHFSQTLTEHNRAVEHYRQLLKDNQS